jgi:biopolymer transport protein ExbD
MRVPRPAPFKRSGDWVLQLINIVFLCLLFFLVNGTITSQQVQRILPPRSASTGAGMPPGDAIFVDGSGTVTFRGRPATVPDIAAQLKADAPRSGEGAPKVEIVADRGLSAARLIELLAELRQLDVGAISLITVKDQPS